MLPRFERLQNITGKTYIYQNDHEPNDIHINVPENPELDIKRIDHRHHALDALIVAATTREHIRYLNSLNAVDTNEELKKVQRSLVKSKIRDFKLPWENFTKEAREKLEETIVSFKVNNKIVSKPQNVYTTWGKDGKKFIKVKKEQEENPKWMAIRKSLFKEPLGVVWLKETKEVPVLEAFEIEIERQLKNTDPKARKTASYIFDKQARQIIKQIIKQCQSSIDKKDALIIEIENYLDNSKKIKTDEVDKNGKTKLKTIYSLNGIEYEKITIAEFKLYKTKRMALTNEEYVKKLTIEKMLNDFPYFDTIGKNQFEQFDAEKQNLITNSGIKVSETKKMNAFNLLFLSHILEYNNDPKEAFGTEGLDLLNKKAKENKSIGKEIKSVTRLDGEVSEEELFNGSFYETDKGANAYFVIYEYETTKERSGFISISTHKAVERIIKGKPIAEDKVGYKKIILSPGDLVYVPKSVEDYKNGILPDFTELTKEYINSLFIVNNFTGSTCYFTPLNFADAIIPKEVDLKFDNNKKIIGSFDKKTASIGNLDIKNVCIKLKVDRLGNVTLA
ncbi:MAG: hypothetical protein NC925_05975 [Candidatus Omnitrophica bacterium]|nr:hypothetical protein [Candidatus Omnitrophota bacterium]